MSWQRLIKEQKIKADSIISNGQAGSDRVKAFATVGGSIVAVSLLLMIFGQYATIDFIFLVTAITALCGLVLYDNYHRRKWEKSLNQELKALIKNKVLKSEHGGER